VNPKLHLFIHAVYVYEHFGVFLSLQIGFDEKRTRKESELNNLVNEYKAEFKKLGEQVEEKESFLKNLLRQERTFVHREGAIKKGELELQDRQERQVEKNAALRAHVEAKLEKHREQIGNEQAKFERRLEAHKTSIQRERIAYKRKVAKHKLKLLEDRRYYKQQIVDLKKDHSERLENAKTAMQKRLDAAAQTQQISQIKTQQEHETFVNRLANQRTAMEHAAAVRQQQLEGEFAKRKDSLEQSMAQQTEKVEREYTRLKASLAARHSGHRKQFEKDLETQSAQLDKQFSRRREKQDAELVMHESKVNAFKAKMENQLAEQKQSFEGAVNAREHALAQMNNLVFNKVELLKTKAAKVEEVETFLKERKAYLESKEASVQEMIKQFDQNKTEYTKTDSDGAGITVWAIYTNRDGEIDDNNPVILGADALGKKGVSSEEVGRRAAMSLRKEIDALAPVDHYLADQLLPFMAVHDESVMLTPEISDHCKSNIQVIEQFLKVTFDIDGKKISLRKLS